jgi:tetratricopeptide (TPR) repeat protein
MLLTGLVSPSVAVDNTSEKWNLSVGKSGLESDFTTTDVLSFKLREAFRNSDFQEVRNLYESNNSISGRDYGDSDDGGDSSFEDALLYSRALASMGRFNKARLELIRLRGHGRGRKLAGALSRSYAFLQARTGNLKEAWISFMDAEKQYLKADDGLPDSEGLRVLYSEMLKVFDRSPAGLQYREKTLERMAGVFKGLPEGADALMILAREGIQGECSFDRYLRARQFLRDVIHDYSGSRYAEDACFLIAETFYKEGRYNDSLLAFRRYLDFQPQGIQAETAGKRIQWITRRELFLNISSTVLPGKTATLTVQARNIDRVFLQIIPIDLFELVEMSRVLTWNSEDSILPELISKDTLPLLGTTLELQGFDSHRQIGCIMEFGPFPPHRGGAYLVRSKAGEIIRYQVVTVASLAVMVKHDSNGLLIFATDIFSGKPSSAGQVLIAHGHKYLRDTQRYAYTGISRTNMGTEGVCKWVFSNDQDHRNTVVLVRSDHGTGIGAVSYAPVAIEDNSTLLMWFPDKTDYFPGDPVQFRIFARIAEAPGLFSPVRGELSVKVTGKGFSTTVEGLLDVRQAGSFSGRFFIPPEASAGNCEVCIEMVGKTRVIRNLSVIDRSRDTLSIQADVQPIIRYGSTVEIPLTVTNRDGAGLGEVRIDFTLKNITELNSSYQKRFSVQDSAVHPGKDDSVYNGTLRTDGLGRTVLTIPADGNSSSGHGLHKLRVVAEDGMGGKVAREWIFLSSEKSMQLSVKTSGVLFRPGESIKLGLSAASPFENINDRKVEVILNGPGNLPQTGDAGTSNGKAGPPVRVYQTVVSNGEAELSIESDDLLPGYYLLTARSEGIWGEEVNAHSEIWIMDQSLSLSRPLTDVSSEDQLRIIPDNVSEKAEGSSDKQNGRIKMVRGLIFSSGGSIPLLLTIEGKKIYQWQVIEPSADGLANFSFAIDSEISEPWVWIKAMGVKKGKFLNAESMIRIGLPEKLMIEPLKSPLRAGEKVDFRLSGSHSNSALADVSIRFHHAESAFNGGNNYSVLEFQPDPGCLNPELASYPEAITLSVPDALSRGTSDLHGKGAHSSNSAIFGVNDLSFQNGVLPFQWAMALASGRAVTSELHSDLKIGTGTTIEFSIPDSGPGIIDVLVRDATENTFSWGRIMVPVESGLRIFGEIPGRLVIGDSVQARVVLKGISAFEKHDFVAGIVIENSDLVQVISSGKRGISAQIIMKPDPLDLKGESYVGDFGLLALRPGKTRVSFTVRTDLGEIADSRNMEIIDSGWKTSALFSTPLTVGNMSTIVPMNGADRDHFVGGRIIVANELCSSSLAMVEELLKDPEPSIDQLSGILALAAELCERDPDELPDAMKIFPLAMALQRLELCQEKLGWWRWGLASRTGLTDLAGKISRNSPRKAETRADLVLTAKTAHALNALVEKVDSLYSPGGFLAGKVNVETVSVDRLKTMRDRSLRWCRETFASIDPVDDPEGCVWLAWALGSEGKKDFISKYREILAARKKLTLGGLALFAIASIKADRRQDLGEFIKLMEERIDQREPANGFPGTVNWNWFLFAPSEMVPENGIEGEYARVLESVVTAGGDHPLGDRIRKILSNRLSMRGLGSCHATATLVRSCKSGAGFFKGIVKLSTIEVPEKNVSGTSMEIAIQRESQPFMVNSGGSLEILQLSSDAAGRNFISRNIDASSIPRGPWTMGVQSDTTTGGVFHFLMNLRTPFPVRVTQEKPFAQAGNLVLPLCVKGIRLRRWPGAFDSDEGQSLQGDIPRAFTGQPVEITIEVDSRRVRGHMVVTDFFPLGAIPVTIDGKWFEFDVVEGPVSNSMEVGFAVNDQSVEFHLPDVRPGIIRLRYNLRFDRAGEFVSRAALAEIERGHGFLDADGHYKIEITVK